ncbi:universal stress protein [Streptomyces sp. DT171]|uniref:universal stress protein n=1 Tax=Streptomyces sp. DT171 TaxID=3416524 RepID=UPI003CF56AC8
MTRPVTVGVDGSPESLSAAEWGAREASRRGAPLRLVHAWEWEPFSAPFDLPTGLDQDALARQAHRTLAAVDETVAGRHPELAVSHEILSRPAVEALVAEADSAELLVLGSRGYGPVSGFLLGSVGQQVIAEARRPVVAVRPAVPSGDTAAEEAAGVPGGEIVVGQHGTGEDTDPVLAFAFEQAAGRGVGVRAVRAWNLPPLYAYNPSSLFLADEAGVLAPLERKRLGEALAPWRAKYPEVPVTEQVELGSAAEVLLSASGRAQLVVVGRRARRGALGSRIGSVTHATLHHVPCPVAVVPHS